MSEEDNYEELNMIENTEDTENLLENEDQIADVVQSSELEFNSITDHETSIIEDTVVEEQAKEPTSHVPARLSARLPLGRIKNIMKMDPDVKLVNSEAVFLVAKATELFLETIAKEVQTYTATKKRKTIAKKDLDYVIDVVDCLCFLEGAMDF